MIISCKECGKKLRISDQNAGKTGRCTSCGARITLPKSDGSLHSEADPADSMSAPKTTPGDVASANERIAILRDVAQRYAEVYLENERMHWGCLLGFLIPPLGIWQVMQMGFRQRVSDQEFSDEIESIATKLHVSRDRLFDDAYSDSQLANQEKFLKRISASRLNEIQYNQFIGQKESEARYEAAIWERYGLLQCAEFMKPKFYMPSICGTCGVPLVQLARGGHLGTKISFNQKIDALQHSFNSVVIPQCESCHQQKPVLEGKALPMPIASCAVLHVAGRPPHNVEQFLIPESIGPLHNDFVREFLTLNHHSGVMLRMVKCSCGTVYCSGKHAACPHCQRVV
jgi:DNA-directed RNA polymerase subunit RPC12/RpoP